MMIDEQEIDDSNDPGDGGEDEGVFELDEVDGELPPMTPEAMWANHVCAFCGKRFPDVHEWMHHAEIEMTMRVTRPNAVYDDLYFRIVDHPEKPLIVVREPHLEGGWGDDGQESRMCDEGWYWDGGERLNELEFATAKEWISDYLNDNCR